MNKFSQILLEATNLKKTYDGGLVQAVHDVSITLEKGKLYVLSGRSGCGKSTLLHLLGTLDTPDRGTILFEGNAFESMDSLTRFRRENLGFIFQFQHLLPLLSLRENVETALVFCHKFSDAERRERVDSILIDVGLEDRMHQYANLVSGGERQRAAIARALVTHPKLILADEPTGNVDSLTAKAIMEILKERIQKEGMTALVATHDPLVRAYADTIFYMEDGHIQRVENAH